MVCVPFFVKKIALPFPLKTPLLVKFPFKRKSSPAALPNVKLPLLTTFPATVNVPPEAPPPKSI